MWHHSFLNITFNHFPLLLFPVRKTCLQFSGITKRFPKYTEYPYTQAHALRLTQTNTHTHTHTHTHIIHIHNCFYYQHKPTEPSYLVHHCDYQIWLNRSRGLEVNRTGCDTKHDYLSLRNQNNQQSGFHSCLKQI